MLRIETIWTGLGGSPYFTRLHFAGATESLAQQAVTNLGTAWTNLMGGTTPMGSGQAVLQVQPEVTVIDEPTGQPTGTFVVTAPGPFTTSSGTIVPRATQGLLRLLTSDYVGGRRVRGKVFIPAIATSQNTSGGKPSSTLQARIAAFGAELQTTELVVYSRPTEDRVGAAYTVTSSPAWDEWAVLTSRRD